MLLTSGQVSVAISSVVVVLFTAALFLSGYVLQQKTVRDIRTAIRPQVISMQDRLYLPPQFETPTIQVLQDEESELVINMRQGSSSDPVGTKKVKKTKEGISSSERVAQQGSREIQDPILPMDGERPVQEENEVGPPPDSDPASHSEDTPEEKPLSRAERRKKIKEEILAVGEGDGFKGYRRRMW